MIPRKLEETFQSPIQIQDKIPEGKSKIPEIETVLLLYALHSTMNTR
jgi:hypothetical protein